MLQFTFTFKFTCKFTYIFTFTFTSKLFITLIPFMLQSWNLYDIYPQQDLRLCGRVAPGLGQGSECITGHIEHIQNGNRIISLVQLLALES